MAKYVKKPIPVEAIKNVNGIFSEEPDWLWAAFAEGVVGEWEGRDGTFGVITLEGVMTCPPGCYLVRGVRGELYPCQGDIFEETYELVEEG